MPLKVGNEEPRQIIVSSFAPHVTVYASEDTDSIAAEKGFEGICDLLKPFGEKVQGKVVVRDSGGASRGWEDFSIRIFRYGGNTGNAGRGSFEQNSNASTSSYFDRLPSALNAVVDYHLQSADEDERLQKPGAVTAAYILYLRKLLADSSPVPYETISHPVACIITVSSRDPQPLEKIRELYSMSGRRDKEEFPWIGTEYLRYYVLVHDEDTDDITKSTALFDLMKRHFGLHCHLLRLRSAFCIEMDDNSSKVPECLWLSAQEDLAHIEASRKSFPTWFMQAKFYRSRRG